MKWFWLLLIVVVGLSVSHAKEKATYQTGKLVDIRAHSTGAGRARAQYSFCLAIQVDDISYITRYETWSHGAYQPTDLIVGDPIEIRTKGDDLYFKAGKKSRDESKAHIIRRERITLDSKPATCALPVAVDR
jgi:hypothetical protein